MRSRPRWASPRPTSTRWFDDEAHTHVKVAHYPGREQVESDQGVGAHKDYGWLALLLQDDLGGLQVEAKDGSWIDAVPMPGAFVFNIGEMLEVATQGYLRATRHRVVSPPARAGPLQHPRLPRAAPGRRRPAAAAPARAGGGGERRRGGSREPDPRRVRLATSCADGCAATPASRSAGGRTAVPCRPGADPAQRVYSSREKPFVPAGMRRRPADPEVDDEVVRSHLGDPAHSPAVEGDAVTDGEAVGRGWLVLLPGEGTGREAAGRRPLKAGHRSSVRHAGAISARPASFHPRDRQGA